MGGLLIKMGSIVLPGGRLFDTTWGADEILIWCSGGFSIIDRIPCIVAKGGPVLLDARFLACCIFFFLMSPPFFFFLFSFWFCCMCYHCSCIPHHVTPFLSRIP